jgi:hypothetical protein
MAQLQNLQRSSKEKQAHKLVFAMPLQLYKCSSCFATQEEQGSGYVRHQHRKDLLKKPLHLKQQKRQERWCALFEAMFMDKRNPSQTGNLEYYRPYRAYKTFFVSPDKSL